VGAAGPATQGATASAASSTNPRTTCADPPHGAAVGRAVQGGRGDGAADRHAVRGHQPQVPVGGPEVGRHEGHLRPVPGQHADDRTARLLRGARRHGRELAEVAQHPQPPLPHHARRGVADGDEDPADPAALVLDRGVGERPVRLLQVAVPAQEQLLVLGERGALAGEHRLGHRAELGPRLRPHPRGTPAQGVRVLVAHRRDVGVVVEDRQLRAPPHVHREPRRQADRQRGLQALRPAVRGAHGGARPVVGPHARRHPVVGPRGEPGRLRHLAHPLTLPRRPIVSVASSLSPGQPEPPSGRHRLAARPDVELAEDRRHVVVRRLA
jgi:hypothetical protein